MFALRSSFDHFKVQTNNCIPAAHFGFACARGIGVSVVRAAPGVRAGVADGCVQHGAGRRKEAYHRHARDKGCARRGCRRVRACGTGLADGGVTHALLDVAISLSHSLSILFSLARFLSLSHARSFSLSLSLSLSHTHTNMLGAIILILMPSDSD